MVIALDTTLVWFIFIFGNQRCAVYEEGSKKLSLSFFFESILLWKVENSWAEDAEDTLWVRAALETWIQIHVQSFFYECYWLVNFRMNNRTVVRVTVTEIGLLSRTKGRLETWIQIWVSFMSVTGW